MKQTDDGCAVKKPPLWVLIFMISLGPFGDTEYIPSLPAMAQHFQISYNMVQQTMTFYLVGFALFQLVYGCFSDRYGRRPMMLFGIGTFVLGSVICTWAPSIMLLYLGRFIQGIGSCAGATITNACVRDAFPLEDRPSTYAKINAAFALAPGVGPIVGSGIETYFHWKVNFILLFVLGIALLLSVYFFLPETNHNKRRDATNLRRLLYYSRLLYNDPLYMYYLILLGCCVGIVYSCLTEAPALVNLVLGLQTHVIVIVAMGVMLGFMMGSFACAYLSRRWHPNKILITGISIILTFSLIMSAFVIVGFVNLATMLSPIIIIFSGIALINPTAMSQALHPMESITGTAASVLGFTQMLFAALGTLFISIIHNGTARAMPITFTAIGLLALSIYWFFIRARRDCERAVI